MRFETAGEAFAARDRILQGVLQPSAIDIVNWPSGFRLLVQAGGSERVLERYERELAGAEMCAESVWEEIRAFTPRFLAEHPQGSVRAIPAKLTGMPALIERLGVPVIARAGSGVVYAHYSGAAPEIEPGSGFAMMTRVKEMFDPNRLLNRGRLHGRL